MLLPIRDENPLRVIAFQRVTFGIVMACVVVFLWQASHGPAGQERIVYALGTIPAVLFGQARLAPELAWVAPELTVATAMFLHGSFWHLIGNMLFLWVFGDNIEDAMGHGRFLVFYLVCGAVGTLLHGIGSPASEVPLIGASGAVSGVLGAYLVLHPRVKILVLAFSVLAIRLPAYVLLAGWAAMQVFNAVFAADAPVAWLAHIGGFAAGALLVGPMRRRAIPLFDRGVRH